mgnify:CR=1 FL=1
MGVLALIIALEMNPMITLIRWRIQVRSGQQPDMSVAARLARVSEVQAVLVVLMVRFATAMARGYGAD